MGDKARRSHYFLTKHPICCYCGRPAETEDHCPPRTFFQNRNWPQDFSFPSCLACNSEGRLHEQIVACLYRLSLKEDAAENRQTMALITAIRNNSPEILAEWTSGGPVSKKRNLRQMFGQELGDRLRYAGFGHVTIGKLTFASVEYFGHKIARALYYKHIGQGLIGYIYCTVLNTMTQRDVLDVFLSLAPNVTRTQRQNRDLSDQFAYRFNFAPQAGTFLAAVFLGPQACYLILAIAEANHADMVAQHPGLQSQLGRIFERYAYFGPPGGTTYPKFLEIAPEL